MKSESPSLDRTTPLAAGVDPRLTAGLGVVLIVLATFAAYVPALHGDLIWDDDAYVSENIHLTMPGGLWRIWFHPRESPQYYPLVFTSFWLEAHLWGLSTFGLHVVNVALHAAGALVLWYVLWRLRVPGAWLAGAIFALHPVHVESVAWITERKNVLSALFYLLSFAAWLKFHDRRRNGMYAVSLLLFVAALLSKTVTCSLPVAILIAHWWRGDRIDRRMLAALAPYVAVGAALGLNTVLLERVHVGAMGPEWKLSMMERGLIAGRALWFYAAKLVWPGRLVFNYPRWEIDAGAAWQHVFPAGFIAVVLLLWTLRGRLGRGPVAALAFFAITLTPALGFFDVYPFRYSFVADHFQYHASMGLIALAAAGLARLWSAPLRSAAGRSALRIVPAAVVVAVAVRTYYQAGVYGDIETLWRRTLAENPDSWLSRFNLGSLLVQRGELTAAEAEFREVLRINPRLPDTHVSLGNIASKRGEHERAMAAYRAALAIDPNWADAYYNMARELERVGDVDGAIAGYTACLERDPGYWAAHNNLGRVLLERGRLDEARAHFLTALQYEPSSAAALHNFGMTLEREGQFAAAIEYYVRAATADPTLTSAWHRLAIAWKKLGGMDQAEAALHKTLQLDPQHVEALADLAALDYERGRIASAVQNYRRAVALNPRDVPVRINLSAALERAGEFAEARSNLEAGLDFEPDHLALMYNLAKLLATCPDAALRDGARAVQLAEEVVRQLDPPRPEALGVLAAAYAEVGNTQRAHDTLDRAIELAGAAGMEAVAARLLEQKRRLPARNGG